MVLPAAAPGSVIAGRYQLETLLGQGGMAQVYRARHLALDAPVAIKFLHRPGDAAGQTRFLTEARVMAQLRTRYAVQVFDFGVTEEGQPFLVMELLLGETLAGRLARRARLPVDETVRHVAQIARALTRAHALGIVHRDLKPENLFVVRDEDGKDLLKVMDFGIAKLLGSLESFEPAPEEPVRPDRQPTTRTSTGTRLGTPRFMAPEQVEARAQVGPAADIWALGVVAFVCLTGRHPFDGPDVSAVFDSILRGSVPPVRALDRAIPAAFDEWFQRACARAPSARFDTPREAARALAFALDVKDAQAEQDLRETEGDDVTDGTAHDARARLPEAAGRSVLDETLGTMPVGRTMPDAPRRGSRAILGLGALAAVGCVSVATVLALGRRGAPPPAPPTVTAVTASSVAKPPPPDPPRVQRVTVNPRQNHVRKSTLSPDGRSIAFDDAAGLHIRTLDPPATRELAVKPGEQPQNLAFYPDGRTLLVGFGSELVSFDLDTGARTHVADIDAHAVPAVSPDGSRIAIAMAGRIVVMPSSGGAATEVAKPTERVYALAWSPGGRSLAYDDEANPSSIATVDTVTLARHVLVADDHLTQEDGISALAWLADGRLLYSYAQWLPAEAGSNLYAMPVDEEGRATAPAARVTDWTGMVVAELSASLKGRVAFQRHQMQADVYLGDLSPSGRALTATRRLTMSDRNERDGSFTRDGKSITLMSDRFGRYDVFEHPLGEDSDRLLADDANAWCTWPVVTPDGATLFWRVDRTDDHAPVHPVLERLEPGGAPRPLWTADEMVVAGMLGRPPPYARVRCGERACFASHTEGDELVVTELDPVSGPGREVFRTRASSLSGWDVSRDGSAFAVPLVDGSVELWEAPFANGRTLAHGMFVESVAWLPKGDALVATGVDVAREFQAIGRVDRQGHAAILTAEPSVWFAHPEVSPDGKHLAYTTKPYDDDVWIVDGL